MADKPSLDVLHVQRIAREVGCDTGQVQAAATLLDEGATVPFIARYRKEVTGGLADDQLETIAKRRGYFLELVERRDAVLAVIDEQGKLTADLEAAIRRAVTKQELEDLYLPFKKKRRTKAEVARERGLEPLADAIVRGRRSRDRDPRAMARSFVAPQRDVADIDAALEGARHIVAEWVAEDPDHRATLRRVLARTGAVQAKLVKGKREQGQTFRDYFDHAEPGRSIASHRLLAVLRGEREGILRVALVVDDDRQVEGIARAIDANPRNPCGEQVVLAIRDGYRRLLRPSLANEVLAGLKERAEEEAIRVFRANLDALLLQSPLGQLPVVGLDPGYRTGCKLAALDGTGKVLATDVIYPVPPRADEARAGRTLVGLIRALAIRAVAIGNGTASRETEQFARRAVRDAGLTDVIVAIVPETGASVYSASAVARDELPDMDVSLRGAVSIARRLQDPLAELVKIEPRSLGVGQYQHDVNARRLGEELDRTVESAVNQVGVELNSASASLLGRVAGLSERMARNVVEHRDAEAPFTTRRQLLKVAGIGPKAFEQAAGFCRIRGGKNPLDATAVHPERYPLVEAMAGQLGVSLADLVGAPARVARVDFARFVDEERGIGRFTLDDIRAELERPGRDPRPAFVAPSWRDDVCSIDDLEEGMVLEGRVSNVTNFGAFVDIGVKRDGLVHVSQLTHGWSDDPHKVVRVGQIVKIQVTGVDHQRERISLSMKALEDRPC
ncbi:MAG: Tex family protein [Myxococcota bacterium]|nr:Tex family protein [Myxococcota bacterium]